MNQDDRAVLRNAAWDDMDLCFDWANDPAARQYSHHTEAIPYEDHVKWFRQKLDDPHSCFWIYEIDGTPAGQIRFDIDASAALLSYSIAPPFRGQGHALPMLVKGIEKLAKEVPGVRTILADVSAGNVASLKVFDKAGFETQSIVDGFYKKKWEIR